MISEVVTRRLLAAVRFVDTVTGLPAPGPFEVDAAGARLAWNRSGFALVLDAPGLGDPATAAGSVPLVLTVRDPARRYLPRRLTLMLPRDPDPANADDAGSIFRPVDARVFLAPGAAPGANWALVRVSARRGADKAPVRGALVRASAVVGGATLGVGLSDRNGEALVAIPGVAAVAPGGNGGAVLSHGADVRLDLFVDPGRKPDDPTPPDTDDLESRAGSSLSSSATLDVHVDPGRETPAPLTLA